ncbi:hypothetical protein Fsol_00007 [Candidatus Fokinia solitaria]|uniref:Uncharacterized protein n=1 Tax=Candidatus Fokinia solitaria TaxID=1802984 RepID=A0A2U8BR38_9RICK|nr:hypothetical protein [Candidatus Fokinia solitaria]AWD32823.1 hypothetical protein Fsol_00007 [Candidatus Fokinia solitaria]
MIKTSIPLHLFRKIEELLKKHSYNFSSTHEEQHSDEYMNENMKYYFFSELDTIHFTPSITIKVLDIEKTSHFTFDEYLVQIKISIVNEKHKDNEQLLRTILALMLSVNDNNTNITEHSVKTFYENDYNNTEILFTYSAYISQVE